MNSRRDLAAALRLVVITDRALAEPRTVTQVVSEALAAGARAIQLRDKHAGGAALLDAASEMRLLTRRFGALLVVNDRLDVALAAEADGVHLGPDDLPVSAVRSHAPPGFIIGYSTGDPAEATRAVTEGADYVGCGAVYSTATKADAGRAIGTEGLDRVASAVAVPVIAVGGIDVARARRVAETKAAGVAVIGAVMGAANPDAIVRALLAPFAERSRP